MSTIASLVVQLGGDNRDLQRMFTDSAERAQRFASKMTQLVDNTKFVKPDLSHFTTDTGQLEEYRKELELTTAELQEYHKVYSGVYANSRTGDITGTNGIAPIQNEITALNRLISIEQQEISEYQSGVNQKIKASQEFASASLAAMGEAGPAAAEAFVNGLKTTLAESMAAVQEEAARGFITPAQAATEGKVAAVAYNEAILTALDSLGTMGLGEEVYRNITSQLQSSLNKAGIAGGRELGIGMAAGLESETGLLAEAGQRAVAPFIDSTAKLNTTIRSASGAFTNFGRRGSTALIGLGFGIESFANGTQTGMRRAMRSLETFAIFFGPEGLMVAGLITGGLAIFDFFHKAEKRAEESVKKLSQLISNAANSMDEVGLEKQMRTLQYGEPTRVDDKSGKLIVNATSQFAQNAFEGSGADLQAHIESNNKRIIDATHAGNVYLVGQLTKETNDLQKRLDPIAKAYFQVQQLILNPAAQSRMPVANKPIKVSAKSNAGEAAQAHKDMVAQISGLVTQLEVLKAAGGDYSGTMIRLSDMLEVLGNVKVRAAGESWEKYTQRVSEAKKITDAFAGLAPKINVPDIKLPKLPDLVGEAFKKLSEHNQGLTTGFDAQLEQFKTFQEQVTISNQAALAQGKPTTSGEDVLGPMRKALALSAVQIKASLASALADPKTHDAAKKVLDDVLSGMNAIGLKSNEVTGHLQQWANALGNAASAMSAMAGLADAIDPNSGVGKLANGLGNLASSAGAAIASGGTDVGADISALTDVFKVGQTLEGQGNMIRKENLAVVNANTQTMIRLNATMAGFEVNANTSGKAQEALIKFFADPSAVHQLASGATHSGGFLGMSKVGDLQTQINALTPTLTQFGLTFTELKTIAQQYGIDIFDKNGRIITSALQQLASGLATATKASFTFSNTLGDQQTLANLQYKLSGKVQDPQNDMKNTLALIGRLAPNLLPGASGLDVNSMADRDALRKLLQVLVARISGGTENTADFGAFQSLSEVTGVIDALSGSLVTLTNTTNGLNESLQNVARGFRIRLDTFDATAFGAPASALIPPASTPVGGSGGSTTLVIQTGAIQVTTPNAADAADTVLTGLGNMAAQRFGNRTKWTQLVPRSGAVAQ